MPVYDTPLHTNDRSLDRVLHAGLPVALVLFDSRREFDPALDEALKQVAKAEAGILLVTRVDVQDNPGSAARWGGAGLPSLVLFRAGEALGDVVHPVTAADFRAWTDYLLERGPRPQMQSAHATRSAANGNGNGARTSARQDLTRPVAVTDATFQQEVLESDVPVVVDFWAAWCGPCRMIGPVLEKLAGELDGRVKIAKVDVDQYQHYAQHYGVQGIPTLLFVRGGQVVDRVVGALPEPYLRQRVNVFANPQ